MKRIYYNFVVLICMLSAKSYAVESFCPNGQQPKANIIWCDSFENEDLGPNGTIDENYYEFNNDGGEHSRVNYESTEGSYSLRVHWQKGATSAGDFKRTFGRNPIGSQSHTQQDFNEIYWRIYVKLQEGFIGQPDKFSRATIFASNNWAQGMIAHLWASDGQFLEIDPATGINNQSQLATTQWNDFSNLKFLGAVKGTKTLTPGTWHCIEAHVKLNAPGLSDGIFEYWMDNELQAGRTDLNWVYSWQDYKLNSIIFSNYWGAGSPQDQERYFDALVISTERIGCMDRLSPPLPPENFSVR